MNKKSILSRLRGFTLIELLIVVAIIAILAAIAVPNFLEAQTRAKVTRTLADMRTIRISLESYAVDSNKYPETDGGIQLNGVGTVTDNNPDNPIFTIDSPPQGERSILRLTSPISYISSLPASPWKENYGVGGGDLKIATAFRSYLYVRAQVSGFETSAGGVLADFGADYIADRRAYAVQGQLVPPLRLGKGSWLLKSSGPDARDDRNVIGNDARIYDSTNGTISAGDIVIFSDISEPRATN